MKTVITQPLTFRPYLKPVIWGGDAIAPFKGIKDAEPSIGESWEISSVKGHESVVDRGELAGKTLPELIAEYGADLVGKECLERYGTTFPLLIKIIDARQNLSVQVHPDDALAASRHGCMGKTEMWYIIATQPGARIYCGLDKEITPEEYAHLVETNRIMDVIAAYDSAPGDVFFLPAGRVHAIGAGNLLAEIQQTSDITYRIYDYDRRDAQGNPRELHTELAKDAIDYTVYPSYKEPRHEVAPDAAPAELVKCDYFDSRLCRVEGHMSVSMDGRDCFMVVINVSPTEAMVGFDGNPPVTLHGGCTALVPASARTVEFSGRATLLTATL